MKTCLPARTAAEQLDGSCAGGALGENGCEECWNKKNNNNKKRNSAPTTICYSLYQFAGGGGEVKKKQKKQKLDQCFFKLKQHGKYTRFVLRSGIM